MKLRDTLYEKFTPRERLGLFYAAMARKDYAEADRLADTCEQKSYRMRVASFQQNMQYIHMSCLHAILLIEEAKFRAMAALGVLIYAQVKAHKKRRDTAIDVYIAMIGKILGTWEAWQEFCAVAGVDPDAVMQTCWGGAPSWINDAPPLDIHHPIDADPEAKAEALSLFMGHWRVIQERNAA